MSWFTRIKDGITTKTKEKKEVPEGIWYQCPSCKKTVSTKEFNENLKVCPNCGFHGRISALEYFEIILDPGFEQLFGGITTHDFLDFKDLKSYDVRLLESREKSGLDEAMLVAKGEIHEKGVVIAAMDFSFIGGSMGTVVGEKIAYSIDHCLEHNIPLIIISKSGGARMMESAFSLMQMVKTAAKLSQLSSRGIPYISLMTDPTTGGVSASFAMLGDINMAEPGAMIGFAGPRVIEETIKKPLPEGFQSAESLQENGFLDMIVTRHELKQRLSDLIELLSD